ncbi:hypothetical protein D3C81_1605620 [compost metagenome]
MVCADDHQPVFLRVQAPAFVDLVQQMPDLAIECAQRLLIVIAKATVVPDLVCRIQLNECEVGRRVGKDLQCSFNYPRI